MRVRVVRRLPALSLAATRAVTRIEPFRASARRARWLSSRRNRRERPPVTVTVRSAASCPAKRSRIAARQLSSPLGQLTRSLKAPARDTFAVVGPMPTRGATRSLVSPSTPPPLPPERGR